MPKIVASAGPLFSVIIPSYNGAALLERCLHSLEKVRFPSHRREWIVVDNGSGDGTVSMVQRRFPKTKIVSLSRNLGFTGGIAAGVAAAEGRYVVFLNNDMRVAPQWLEAMEEALRGRGAVCAAGKILDKKGEHIDFIEGILLFDGHALQRFQGARAEHFSGLSTCPAFIACGGNMAVRKDVYESLGGFDGDFFAYTEDVDFSWRLHAAGFETVFVPEAVTLHDHQATSSRFGPYRRGFLYERNAFACLYKNIDEPFFHPLVHLAWLTLMHRTRWIIALHEPQSLGALESPFPPWSGLPDGSSESALEATFLRSPQRSWRKTLRRGVDLLRQGELQTLWYRLAEILRDRLRRGKGKGLSSLHPEEILWRHPYVRSQLQALWDLSRSMARLNAKRRSVQRRRRVPDRDIFRRFPPWVVTTYPGDEELFAASWFRDLLPKEIPFRFASLEEVHGDPPPAQRHHTDL